jgi:hypothetical protein
MLLGKRGVNLSYWQTSRCVQPGEISSSTNSHNLKAAAKAVINAQRTKGGIGPASALYSFASFRQTFGELAGHHPGATLSETDARVLVKHLERDRSCVVVDRQADVIKFVEEGASDREAITTVDKGVLEMSVTASKLQEQVDEIQKRIDEYVLATTSRICLMSRIDERRRSMSCYARSKRNWPCRCCVLERSWNLFLNYV